MKNKRKSADDPAWNGTEGMNINISAYRVLYILLLLVRYQSLSLTELNRHLFDNLLIQRIYNGETITKYINTLRRLGCEIPRSSNRNDFHYELLQNPFPLSLDNRELEILQKILVILARRADKSLTRRYEHVLQKIAWNLANEQQARQVLQVEEPASMESVRRRQALLMRYHEYCIDARVLSLSYQQGPSREQNSVAMTVEPMRVVEEGSRLYLLGQDCQEQQRVKLNLDKIYAVRQLPSKNRVAQPETTVVFQIYGRLARNYRPYPGEEVHAIGGETLQVRARTDDPSGLVRRLLKYDHSCQVISPSCVRQDMARRIQTLLATAQGENIPALTLIQEEQPSAAI